MQKKSIIGLAGAAVVAAAVAIPSFSPETDQSRTLGNPEERWGTAYTTEINDGQGNSINVAETAQYVAAKDHSALTPESRAAGDSHPIAAITGLSATLQPATSVSDGLMAAGDKDKLDNLDSVYLSKSGGVMTGPLTLDADPVDDLEAATKRYADAADTTLGQRLDGVEATANNSVQYDAEGDVPLQAGTNIQVVIPQPDDPTTGDPVDPIERTLLDTDAAGNFIVGSSDSELNLQASMRPTVAVAGGDPDGVALQSDLTDFVNESSLSEDLAYKADLVGGTVPTSQLPPGAISKNFTVDEESDLVTLTTAVPNDRALVLNTAAGGPETMFLLWTADPTVATNWQNITGSGGDVGAVTSVNGMQGAVTVDLDNLPNVQNALDDKADASAVVTLAGHENVPGNKNFTGVVNVPTVATTTNDATAASTAFVNTRIAAGNTATATTLQTARTIQTNLASTTAVSFNGSVNVTPGVTGVLPVANGGTGNTTGLAASATKLATARTMRTNLASTATASFDGSANIAPGVTGTLPIANGGTGVTTAAAARTALGIGSDTVASKGTRSTTGTWTISGLTANKPLYITLSGSATGTNAAGVKMIVTSGISPTSTHYRSLGWVTGETYGNPQTEVIIPSTTSVAINVTYIAGTSALLTARQ